MVCLVCEKHAGLRGYPPGGYFYEDEHWKVCHAPVDKAVPGKLFLEAKRHYRDFAAMTADEVESYGRIVQRLYVVLQEVTCATTIYNVVITDGVPHFFSCLIPLPSNVAVRGVHFLAKDWTCTLEDASAIVEQLRRHLTSPTPTIAQRD